MMYAVAVSRSLESHVVGASNDGGLWLLMSSSGDSVVAARCRFAWQGGSVSHADAENAFLCKVGVDMGSPLRPPSRITPIFMSPIVHRVVEPGGPSTSSPVAIYGDKLRGYDVSIIRGRGESAAWDLATGARAWTARSGTYYADDDVAILDGAIVDVKSGVKRGSLPAHLQREPRVTRSGELIACGGRFDGLAIVDVTGRVRWARQDIPMDLNCRAVFRNDIVAVTYHEENERPALYTYDVATGASRARVELPKGWARDVFAIDAGFIVLHEDGVLLVDDKGDFTSLAPVSVENAELAYGDGRCFAGIAARGDHVHTLVLVAPTGETRCILLEHPVSDLHVENGAVILDVDVGTERLHVRIDLVAGDALSDIDDALAVDAYRIDIVKSGSNEKPALSGRKARVTLGRRIEPTRRRPDEGAIALAQTLIDAGLLEGPVESLERTLLRTFTTGVDDAGAAYLLQTVHGCDGGAERGFICHDWRFGSETDDVIAEFQRALPGEPVTLRQTENDDVLSFEVRVVATDETDEVTIYEVNSLEDVVNEISRVLSEHGAKRSIYSLETNGDWYAYVILDEERAKILRDGGIELR